MTGLLITRPFDQEIHTYDEAAAWARLMERMTREIRYRQQEDLPALHEVSLAEVLPDSNVVPLHGYSVRIPPANEARP